MVGVTQKEHREISLPQKPQDTYRQLKSMANKDLTNNILVFSVSVCISNFTICVPILTIHMTLRPQ